MQVNSSNGSLQQRFFSGTGSIGGIHLPDFNDKYIFSKKKSGVSDKEYRKQIREQAYEDFEKGQFQNKSEGFNRLMKSYTSEVSPDRKGIITSGLKAISRNRQNVLKPIDFVATLLEGKVKYQKLPSGNSDYIEFYDKNGEMVATYSNNGWTMYTTNAEAARQTEMCMIYNEAWGNAKRGIPMAGEEMVNDAEHAWHMAIMTMLLSEYANEPIDVLHTIGMLLIHDLVEIDAGDTYAYDEEGKKTQADREKKAADRIYGLLPEEQGKMLYDLWLEFEAQKTPEAKFARVMDNLQPMMLNAATDGKAWVEHGVHLAQIMKRNEHTAEYSETLMEYAREMFIQPNLDNGHIIEDEKK